MKPKRNMVNLLLYKIKPANSLNYRNLQVHKIISKKLIMPIGLSLIKPNSQLVLFDFGFLRFLFLMFPF